MYEYVSDGHTPYAGMMTQGPVYLQKYSKKNDNQKLDKWFSRIRQMIISSKSDANDSQQSNTNDNMHRKYQQKASEMLKKHADRQN